MLMVSVRMQKSQCAPFMSLQMDLREVRQRIHPTPRCNIRWRISRNFVISPGRFYYSV